MDLRPSEPFVTNLSRPTPATVEISSTRPVRGIARNRRTSGTSAEGPEVIDRTYG